MKRFLGMPTVAALALLIGGVGSAKAGGLIGYGTGPGQPWGLNDNVDAMNTVFGAGNWNSFDFSTPAGATALDNALTSGAYKMIFLDGGDGTTSSFESFVTTYGSDLQSFVQNGGSLILNAARWPDGIDTLNLGFGGVALQTDNNYDYASTTGTAVDPTNPLFQNLGFGSPGTAWTGDYFSHDIVTGPYGTSLITGTSGTNLAEEQYGSGFVMFGGITSPSFQSGVNGDPFALRDNMLYVAANFNAAAVPEPSSFTLLSIAGSTVAGYFGWRRRKQMATA